MDNKHYLYKHIRLDKNEVFYVGIGTIQKNSSYKRAFSVFGRSSYWKRITSKTDYKVEIILESNNFEFIKQKEIEFIKLYGRKDLGLGTLCNLTDGGEGATNVIIKEETRNKISKANKGKKRTQEQKLRLSECRKGIKLSEEHKSKLFSEIHRKNLSIAAKGKSNMKGKKHKKSWLEKVSKQRIINTETGEIYLNVRIASENINVPEATLYNWLTGKNPNKSKLKYLSN